MWSGRRAGKSISSAGYAEARRRLEMTHRRLKPIRRGLGWHGVAKAPVADQRLQCETSHKPPLLNAVHLDRAAPNNLYWPPDEWLKRGMKTRSGGWPEWPLYLRLRDPRRSGRQRAGCAGSGPRDAEEKPCFFQIGRLEAHGDRRTVKLGDRARAKPICQLSAAPLRSRPRPITNMMSTATVAAVRASA
jgi:hypothetical protein